MEKRALGKTGMQVAPLALGTNVFGWTIDEQSSFKVLDAFVSAGFDLLDTADVYSAWVEGNKGGESETIIGNWIRHSGKRDKIILATKLGSDMGDGKKGLSGRYIMEAVEASLKRLKTDYIDLYQSHYDFDETPLEETLKAYDQLVQQGKVRAIGASNYNAARLQEALKISDELDIISYQTLQPLYNLYDRKVFEQELQPLCVEKGIGVINYYSLASGFLTGKYRSEADLGKSARGGGVKKYLDERGFRILAAMDQVADKYNATLAQISLAWLLTRPSIVAPIASATSPEQLSELVKATELKLDDESLSLLDKASEE